MLLYVITLTWYVVHNFVFLYPCHGIPPSEIYRMSVTQCVITIDMITFIPLTWYVVHDFVFLYPLYGLPQTGIRKIVKDTACHYNYVTHLLYILTFFVYIHTHSTLFTLDTECHYRNFYYLPLYYRLVAPKIH